MGSVSHVCVLRTLVAAPLLCPPPCPLLPRTRWVGGPCRPDADAGQRRCFLTKLPCWFRRRGNHSPEGRAAAGHLPLPAGGPARGHAVQLRLQQAPEGCVSPAPPTHCACQSHTLPHLGHHSKCPWDAPDRASFRGCRPWEGAVPPPAPACDVVASAPLTCAAARTPLVNVTRLHVAFPQGEFGKITVSGASRTRCSTRSRKASGRSVLCEAAEVPCAVVGRGRALERAICVAAVTSWEPGQGQGAVSGAAVRAQHACSWEQGLAHARLALAEAPWRRHGGGTELSRHQRPRQRAEGLNVLAGMSDEVWPSRAQPV